MVAPIEETGAAEDEMVGDPHSCRYFGCDDWNPCTVDECHTWGCDHDSLPGGTYCQLEDCEGACFPAKLDGTPGLCGCTQPLP